jgi:membrane protease YdiL (CAAX protease family)
MRFLKSEAGAIVLWLFAALFTAALLTPHLYDAGKALAESAQTKDYASVIESVATSAGRAELDRYFSRCLLLSALVLLPVLVWRVKRIPTREDRKHLALRKHSWAARLNHLISGLLIGSIALGALAVILNFTGASASEDEALTLGKVFSKALLPALGAGVIEELVFRGLLLGLWLRACSLWTAWLGSSAMFSFVHFLKPPDGVVIAGPRAWDSGFEILGSTLGHFTDPTFFVTEFATLALLGLILAYTRTRTHSLWFPIGLHAGLVFSLKVFSMTQKLNPESPLNPWWIGSDLKSGILPLIALLTCFAASAAYVSFLKRKLEKNPGSTP